MIKINGIGVSPGLALGHVKWFVQPAIREMGALLETNEDVILEMDKFREACAGAIRELTILRQHKNHSAIALDILDTQLEFLADPMLEEDIIHRIRNQKRHVIDAVSEAMDYFVKMLTETGDTYLAARTADLEGVCKLMIRHLNHEKYESVELSADTIIFAADLSPLDTLRLDLSRVAGIVTLQGSRNSHTAILARSRGIPAICGCKMIPEYLLDHMMVIIDGSMGEITIQPDEEMLRVAGLRIKAEQNLNQQNLDLSHVPALTSEGRMIPLMANVSGVEEVRDMLSMGGDGIGLLRTEFLFMQSAGMPDEEEQFVYYTEMVRAADGKPVTIRTLDAGGDKPLSYLDIGPESNPFLGYRAIRYCLEHPEILCTQFKAILRASAFGKCRILLPMISNLEELLHAKKLLADAKEALDLDHVRYDAGILLGIMVETPGAAIISDLLAREVDFLSIGTNDLCQYTLAVDRMNERVSGLYQPLHPALLRMIKMIIDHGHKQGIHVGMCGEMAADPLALPLLLGLGLDELSMHARQIPWIKSEIKKYSLPKCENLVNQAMQLGTQEQIINYLNAEKP